MSHSLTIEVVDKEAITFLKSIFDELHINIMYDYE